MLFPLLVLAFTLVPAIEIALFIRIGGSIGAAATLAVVLFTGIAGASLARSQGFRVLQDSQKALQEGRVPTDELLEGGLVLFGGALLLTPGFLTDLLGLACLLPLTRKAGAALLKRWLGHRLQAQGDGRFQMKGWSVNVGGVRPGPAASNYAPSTAEGDIADPPRTPSSRRSAPQTIDATFDVLDDNSADDEEAVTDRIERPEAKE
ncbi:MAG: membrane protein FxsA [Deltaproteobacteria bacterium]|nr:membrane protein FxsA [Deltaproteobacteria bacterium]